MDEQCARPSARRIRIPLARVKLALVRIRVVIQEEVCFLAAMGRRITGDREYVVWNLEAGVFSHGIQQGVLVRD